MKRFYREALAAETSGGWRVELDGRPVKTQGGQPQVVSAEPLAAALAAEWAGQGEEIDPAALVLRDLTDYALDVVAKDRAAVITDLLRYGETDTLCYRAEPGEPLHRRQLALWEPLLARAEERWDLRFERVSGVLHRAQPDETLRRMEQLLGAKNDFALAALNTLTTLAASLTIGLSALEPEAELSALWTAAELEEDWQAEQWGRDAEAEHRAAGRKAAFITAARFAGLAEAG